MTFKNQEIQEDTDKGLTFPALACRFAAAIFTALLTYIIIAVLFHGSIIYPFDQTSFYTPHGQTAIVDEDIPVTILDAGPQSDVIFYLQGNVASRAHFLDDILAHRGRGYTVITMNWPGSEGRPGPVSEARLKAEALTVMEEIPQLLGRPNVKVHIHGYSMGSGIAAHVASKTNPETLILQSSYSSLCEIMTARTFLPACWLPGVDKWDNRPYVANINAPILQLHGLQDNLIPPAYGKNLAMAFIEDGDRLTVHTYPDVGHNDFWKSGHISAIHDFIRQIPFGHNTVTEADIDQVFPK